MEKGAKHTEETRRKISDSRKGKLVGKDNPFFGKHHTEESRKKISKNHADFKGEKSPSYGKHPSAETRKKMSEIKKGKPNPNAGNRGKKGADHYHWKGGLVKINCEVCGKEKEVKPSHIKKGWGKVCSATCRGIITVRNMKKKDTSIERAIENELISRNIPYTKQVPLLGITLVDFLLLHDVVIYADGDYWHSLSKTKKRDVNQDFILTFHGYRVFRFTETAINKSVKKCIDKVVKAAA